MVKIEHVLYLDSNILERYFKRHYQSKVSGSPLKVPDLFQFFSENSEIKLVVSTWALAEVSEHLWKLYGYDKKEISETIEKFLETFKILVIREFEIKPKILRWIRKFRIESKDSIHLLVALDKNIPILTSDKAFSERGIAVHGIVTVTEYFLEYFPVKSVLSDLDN